MAESTRTVLIDDLDGSDADETFTFEFDGRTYEIDLTSEHAEQLEEAFRLLDPFVDHLRDVSAPSRSTKKAGRPRRAVAKEAAAQKGQDAYDAKAIRAWAWENGIEVSNRGRIPGNIVDKWRASLTSQ